MEKSDVLTQTPKMKKEKIKGRVKTIKHKINIKQANHIANTKTQPAKQIKIVKKLFLAHLCVPMHAFFFSCYLENKAN